LIFEVEEAIGPALPPEADGVGVEADFSGGCDVGESGLLVQEDDQTRPLEQVSRSGAPTRQQPSLDEELHGETGLVEW
jgi:hypothetical protein